MGPRELRSCLLLLLQELEGDEEGEDEDDAEVNPKVSGSGAAQTAGVRAAHMSTVVPKCGFSEGPWAQRLVRPACPVQMAAQGCPALPQAHSWAEPRSRTCPSQLSSEGDGLTDRHALLRVYFWKGCKGGVWGALLPFLK